MFATASIIQFVIKQPCLIAGARPPTPIIFVLPNREPWPKVSDEFTVPLCRGHHREVHRCGDETTWWAGAAIDPSTIARMLWLETRPIPDERVLVPER